MSLFVEDSSLDLLHHDGGDRRRRGLPRRPALASKWRPLWMPVVYMIPLGLALRFFHYALFNGDLLSLHYFITDTLVLVAWRSRLPADAGRPDGQPVSLAL